MLPLCGAERRMAMVMAAADRGDAAATAHVTAEPAAGGGDGNDMVVALSAAHQLELAAQMADASQPYAVGAAAVPLVEWNE
eukprot:5700496-Pleurochrysis_carterae.AAC.1